MSGETVEVVRQGFEAFNRGGQDSRASEALLAPDVLWEVAIGLSEFDGVATGRESGAELSTPDACLLEFRRDTLWRAWTFASRERALEAAGLEE